MGCYLICKAKPLTVFFSFSAVQLSCTHIYLPAGEQHLLLYML